MARIRRTQEEIDAGLTHEQKVNGTSLSDLKEMEKEPEPESTEKRVYKIDPPEEVQRPSRTETNTEPIVEVIREVVKVIDSNNVTVEELVNEAVGDCQWEYLNVKMSDFIKEGAKKALSRLGKDRYRFCFAWPSSLSGKSEETLTFQRAKRKVAKHRGSTKS